MPKFSVWVTVEAPDLGIAVARVLFPDGQPPAGLVDVSAEAVDE